tara:strand:- start:1497 stop:16856 length:15360 start_codon:yes stop_codon:yes gene_type:complete
VSSWKTGCTDSTKVNSHWNCWQSDIEDGGQPFYHCADWYSDPASLCEEAECNSIIRQSPASGHQPWEIDDTGYSTYDPYETSYYQMAAYSCYENDLNCVYIGNTLVENTCWNTECEMQVMNYNNEYFGTIHECDNSSQCCDPIVILTDTMDQAECEGFNNCYIVESCGDGSDPNTGEGCTETFDVETYCGDTDYGYCVLYDDDDNVLEWFTDLYEDDSTCEDMGICVNPLTGETLVAADQDECESTGFCVFDLMDDENWWYRGESYCDGYPDIDNEDDCDETDDGEWFEGDEILLSAEGGYLPRATLPLGGLHEDDYAQWPWDGNAPLNEENRITFIMGGPTELWALTPQRECYKYVSWSVDTFYQGLSNDCLSNPDDGSIIRQTGNPEEYDGCPVGCDWGYHWQKYDKHYYEDGGNLNYWPAGFSNLMGDYDTDGCLYGGDCTPTGPPWEWEDDESEIRTYYWFLDERLDNSGGDRCDNKYGICWDRKNAAIHYGEARGYHHTDNGREFFDASDGEETDIRGNIPYPIGSAGPGHKDHHGIGYSSSSRRDYNDYCNHANGWSGHEWEWIYAKWLTPEWKSYEWKSLSHFDASTSNEWITSGNKLSYLSAGECEVNVDAALPDNGGYPARCEDDDGSCIENFPFNWYTSYYNVSDSHGPNGDVFYMNVNLIEGETLEGGDWLGQPVPDVGYFDNGDISPYDNHVVGIFKGFALQSGLPNPNHSCTSVEDCEIKGIMPTFRHFPFNINYIGNIEPPYLVNELTGTEDETWYSLYPEAGYFCQTGEEKPCLPSDDNSECPDSNPDCSVYCDNNQNDPCLYIWDGLWSTENISPLVFQYLLNDTDPHYDDIFEETAENWDWHYLLSTHDNTWYPEVTDCEGDEYCLSRGAQGKPLYDFPENIKYDGVGLNEYTIRIFNPDDGNIYILAQFTASKEEGSNYFEYGYGASGSDTNPSYIRFVANPEVCQSSEGNIYWNCQVWGCTNSEACNYNPFATEEDGSCKFKYDGSDPSYSTITCGEFCYPVVWDDTDGYDRICNEYTCGGESGGIECNPRTNTTALCGSPNNCFRPSCPNDVQIGENCPPPIGFSGNNNECIANLVDTRLTFYSDCDGDGAACDFPWVKYCYDIAGELIEDGSLDSMCGNDFILGGICYGTNIQCDPSDKVYQLNGILSSGDVYCESQNAGMCESIVGDAYCECDTDYYDSCGNCVEEGHEDECMSFCRDQDGNILDASHTCIQIHPDGYIIPDDGSVQNCPECPNGTCFDLGDGDGEYECKGPIGCENGLSLGCATQGCNGVCNDGTDCDTCDQCGGDGYVETCYSDEDGDGYSSGMPRDEICLGDWDDEGCVTCEHIGDGNYQPWGFNCYFGSEDENCLENACINVLDESDPLVVGGYCISTDENRCYDDDDDTCIYCDYMNDNDCRDYCGDCFADDDVYRDWRKECKLEGYCQDTWVCNNEPTTICDNVTGEPCTDNVCNTLAVTPDKECSSINGITYGCDPLEYGYDDSNLCTVDLTNTCSGNNSRLKSDDCGVCMQLNCSGDVSHIDFTDTAISYNNQVWYKNDLDVNNVFYFNKNNNPCMDNPNLEDGVYKIPNNQDWNTSCSDCKGIPCYDGNDNPINDPNWTQMKEYCYHTIDSTGQYEVEHCCVVDDWVQCNNPDTDMCCACLTSCQDLPGNDSCGQYTWWEDTDGDGLASGMVHYLCGEKDIDGIFYHIPGWVYQLDCYYNVDENQFLTYIVGGGSEPCYVEPYLDGVDAWIPYYINWYDVVTDDEMDAEDLIPGCGVTDITFGFMCLDDQFNPDCSNTPDEWDTVLINNWDNWPSLVQLAINSDYVPIENCMGMCWEDENFGDMGDIDSQILDYGCGCGGPAPTAYYLDWDGDGYGYGGACTWDPFPYDVLGFDSTAIEIWVWNNAQCDGGVFFCPNDSDFSNNWPLRIVNQTFYDENGYYWQIPTAPHNIEGDTCGWWVEPPYYGDNNDHQACVEAQADNYICKDNSCVCQEYHNYCMSLVDADLVGQYSDELCQNYVDCTFEECDVLTYPSFIDNFDDVDPEGCVGSCVNLDIIEPSYANENGAPTIYEGYPFYFYLNDVSENDSIYQDISSYYDGGYHCIRNTNPDDDYTNETFSYSVKKVDCTVGIYYDNGFNNCNTFDGLPGGFRCVSDDDSDPPLCWNFIDGIWDNSVCSGDCVELQPGGSIFLLNTSGDDFNKITLGDENNDVTYGLSDYSPGDYEITVYYPAGCYQDDDCLIKKSEQFTVNSAVYGCMDDRPLTRCEVDDLAGGMKWINCKYDSEEDIFNVDTTQFEIDNDCIGLCQEYENSDYVCNYNSDATHHNSSCEYRKKWYPDVDGDGIGCWETGYHEYEEFRCDNIGLHRQGQIAYSGHCTDSGGTCQNCNCEDDGCDVAGNICNFPHVNNADEQGISCLCYSNLYDDCGECRSSASATVGNSYCRNYDNFGVDCSGDESLCSGYCWPAQDGFALNGIALQGVCEYTNGEGDISYVCSDDINGTIYDNNNCNDECDGDENYCIKESCDGFSIKLPDEYPDPNGVGLNPFKRSNCDTGARNCIYNLHSSAPYETTFDDNTKVPSDKSWNKSCTGCRNNLSVFNCEDCDFSCTGDWNMTNATGLGLEAFGYNSNEEVGDDGVECLSNGYGCDEGGYSGQGICFNIHWWYGIAISCDSDFGGNGLKPCPEYYHDAQETVVGDVCNNTSHPTSHGYNSCCEFGFDYGCKDDRALNFDPDATRDCENNLLHDCLFAGSPPVETDIMVVNQSTVDGEADQLILTVKKWTERPWNLSVGSYITHTPGDILDTDFINYNNSNDLDVFEVLSISTEDINYSGEFYVTIRRGLFGTNSQVLPVFNVEDCDGGEGNPSSCARLWNTSSDCNYLKCCVYEPIKACTDSNAENYYCWGDYNFGVVDNFYCQSDEDGDGVYDIPNHPPVVECIAEYESYVIDGWVDDGRIDVPSYCSIFKPGSTQSVEWTISIDELWLGNFDVYLYHPNLGLSIDPMFNLDEDSEYHFNHKFITSLSPDAMGSGVFQWDVPSKLPIYGRGFKLVFQRLDEGWEDVVLKSYDFEISRGYITGPNSGEYEEWDDDDTNCSNNGTTVNENYCCEYRYDCAGLRFGSGFFHGGSCGACVNSQYVFSGEGGTRSDEDLYGNNGCGCWNYIPDKGQHSLAGSPNLPTDNGRSGVMPLTWKRDGEGDGWDSDGRPCPNLENYCDLGEGGLSDDISESDCIDEGGEWIYQAEFLKFDHTNFQNNKPDNYGYCENDTNLTCFDEKTGKYQCSGCNPLRGACIGLNDGNWSDFSSKQAFNDFDTTCDAPNIEFLMNYSGNNSGRIQLDNRCQQIAAEAGYDLFEEIQCEMDYCTFPTTGNSSNNLPSTGTGYWGDIKCLGWDYHWEVDDPYSNHTGINACYSPITGYINQNSICKNPDDVSGGAYTEDNQNFGGYPCFRDSNFDHTNPECCDDNNVWWANGGIHPGWMGPFVGDELIEDAVRKCNCLGLGNHEDYDECEQLSSCIGEDWECVPDYEGEPVDWPTGNELHPVCGYYDEENGEFIDMGEVDCSNPYQVGCYEPTLSACQCEYNFTDCHGNCVPAGSLTARINVLDDLNQCAGLNYGYVYRYDEFCNDSLSDYGETIEENEDGQYIPLDNALLDIPFLKALKIITHPDNKHMRGEDGVNDVNPHHPIGPYGADDPGGLFKLWENKNEVCVPGPQDDSSERIKTCVVGMGPLESFGADDGGSGVRRMDCNCDTYPDDTGIDNLDPFTEYGELDECGICNSPYTIRNCPNIKNDIGEITHLNSPHWRGTSKPADFEGDIVEVFTCDQNGGVCLDDGDTFIGNFPRLTTNYDLGEFIYGGPDIDCSGQCKPLYSKTGECSANYHNDDVLYPLLFSNYYGGFRFGDTNIHGRKPIDSNGDLDWEDNFYWQSVVWDLKTHDIPIWPYDPIHQVNITTDYPEDTGDMLDLHCGCKVYSHDHKDCLGCKDPGAIPPYGNYEESDDITIHKPSDCIYNKHGCADPNSIIEFTDQSNVGCIFECAMFDMAVGEDAGYCHGGSNHGVACIPSLDNSDCPDGECLGISPLATEGFQGSLCKDLEYEWPNDLNACFINYFGDGSYGCSKYLTNDQDSIDLVANKEEFYSCCDPYCGDTRSHDCYSEWYPAYDPDGNYTYPGQIQCRQIIDQGWSVREELKSHPTTSTDEGYQYNNACGGRAICGGFCPNSTHDNSLAGQVVVGDTFIDNSISGELEMSDGERGYILGMTDTNLYHTSNVDPYSESQFCSADCCGYFDVNDNTVSDIGTWHNGYYDDGCADTGYIPDESYPNGDVHQKPWPFGMDPAQGSSYCVGWGNAEGQQPGWFWEFLEDFSQMLTGLQPGFTVSNSICNNGSCCEPVLCPTLGTTTSGMHEVSDKYSGGKGYIDRWGEECPDCYTGCMQHHNNPSSMDPDWWDTQIPWGSTNSGYGSLNKLFQKTIVFDKDVPIYNIMMSAESKSIRSGAGNRGVHSLVYRVSWGDIDTGWIHHEGASHSFNQPGERNIPGSDYGTTPHIQSDNPSTLHLYSGDSMGDREQAWGYSEWSVGGGPMSDLMNFVDYDSGGDPTGAAGRLNPGGDYTDGSYWHKLVGTGIIPKGTKVKFEIGIKLTKQPATEFPKYGMMRNPKIWVPKFLPNKWGYKGHFMNELHIAPNKGGYPYQVNAFGVGSLKGYPSKFWGWWDMTDCSDGLHNQGFGFNNNMCSNWPPAPMATGTPNYYNPNTYDVTMGKIGGIAEGDVEYVENFRIEPNMISTSAIAGAGFLDYSALCGNIATILTQPGFFVDGPDGGYSIQNLIDGEGPSCDAVIANRELDPVPENGNWTETYYDPDAYHTYRTAVGDWYWYCTDSNEHCESDGADYPNGTWTLTTADNCDTYEELEDNDCENIIYNYSQFSDGNYQPVNTMAPDYPDITRMKQFSNTTPIYQFLGADNPSTYDIFYPSLTDALTVKKTIDTDVAFANYHGGDDAYAFNIAKYTMGMRGVAGMEQYVDVPFTHGCVDLTTSHEGMWYDHFGESHSGGLIAMHDLNADNPPFTFIGDGVSNTPGGHVPNWASHYPIHYLDFQSCQELRLTEEGFYSADGTNVTGDFGGLSSMVDISAEQDDCLTLENC